MYRYVSAISSPHLLRRCNDGPDYLVVADAPAEITGQRLFHLVLRRFGFLVEEGLCAHDHAGRAIPALKRGMIDECLLNGVEAARLRVSESFDGPYVLSVALDRKRHAGEPGLSIYEDGAAPARAVVA